MGSVCCNKYKGFDPDDFLEEKNQSKELELVVEAGKARGRVRLKKKLFELADAGSHQALNILSKESLGFSSSSSSSGRPLNRIPDRLAKYMPKPIGNRD